MDRAWWLSVFPLDWSMMLVVLSFNLFGDWLRDVLAPELRQLCLRRRRSRQRWLALRPLGLLCQQSGLIHRAQRRLGTCQTPRYCRTAHTL
jgi:hypothetical protein